MAFVRGILSSLWEKVKCMFGTQEIFEKICECGSMLRIIFEKYRECWWWLDEAEGTIENLEDVERGLEGIRGSHSGS